MFTVIIAEKEHLDRIQENELFLSPFIDRENMAFCEWKLNKTSLKESVPGLEKSVARKEEWRAVIISSQAGLQQKNPFDLVTYKAPVRKFDTAPSEDPPGDEVTGKARGMNLDEVSEAAGKALDEKLRTYLRELKRAKFEAFDQAVQNPLTRLVTYLCQAPMVSKGINRASEDPEFNEYLEESRRKEELRAGIINGEKINFTLPAEVYCIALRTYENPRYDIPASWVPHEDLYYSSFYDRNLYYNRMRYFIFDILPSNHSNYTFDYIRFLYAVLLMAKFDLPRGAVRPERVYNIQISNDDDALDELLSRYASKLNATMGSIEKQIQEREKQQKERLSDKDARAIFCSSIEVPVIFDHDINTGELFADEKAYKLSEDCPEDEYNVWKEQYKLSQKTLKLLLKQPARAVKKASGDFHGLSTADVDKALLLNDFQAEDIEENILNEEKQMIETEVLDLSGSSDRFSRMEAEDKKICAYISLRMLKRTTVLLGAGCLLLFLIGYLPLVFGNLASFGAAVGMIYITAISLGALFLTGLAVLLYFRHKMRGKIRDYNDVMQSIKGEIDTAASLYSRYLSKACNMMRGFSVLNYRKRTEDAGTLEIRTLKKHMNDLHQVYEETQDIFGRYITGKYNTADEQAEAYPFNFLSPRDYRFELPFRDQDVRDIEYVESGNQIRLPVCYIKAMTIQREELYDE